MKISVTSMDDRVTGTVNITVVIAYIHNGTQYLT